MGCETSVRAGSHLRNHFRGVLSWELLLLCHLASGGPIRLHALALALPCCSSQLPLLPSHRRDLLATARRPPSARCRALEYCNRPIQSVPLGD